ncbi:MAG: hypothetical protein KDC93_06600 [Cyclobacteriaceae bacterium]|jgi:hypothetical protein|nr:hypothetical protein [Cyclobacteriaceae bacterium]
MKLEDIPKKNVFKEPEGYFDELPGIIQSRIAKEEAKPLGIPSFGLVLRYALPVLAVGLALFLIFRQSDLMSSNPEELLASVDTEALSNYLIESDLTTEELLDYADLDSKDIEALNDQLLYPEMDIDVLEEFSTEIEL